MPILLTISFLAGLLTILAPCTLPMVPLMLGATASGGRGRPVGIVLGMAASFTLFSIILAAALDALGLTTDALRLIAVVALAVFGLALLVPALENRLGALLVPLARFGTRAEGQAGSRGGLLGGLVMGAGLGLVWAPCVGPIMASVIALAATRGATLDSAAIALAYALGAGVPLLAIGYGGRALARRVGRLTHTGLIQRGFGALMLLTCLAILFKLDVKVQDAVASALPPDWTNGLYGIEQQATAQKELQNLNPTTLPAIPAAAAPVQAAASATAVPPQAAAQAPAPAKPTSPAVPPQAAAQAPVPAKSLAPVTPAGPALPPSISDKLPSSVALQNLGPAPEVTGITSWINSKPLTVSQLRGKVVLVHFWTFECINCIHVQPYVKDWYARYKDAGFVVLGIHTPELSFEKDINNVRNAVRDQGVLFPVAFDPQYSTWSAFHNNYWPASYFVDKQGRIRYTHAGEGAYDEQEQVIRQLLGEPASPAR